MTFGRTPRVKLLETLRSDSRRSHQLDIIAENTVLDSTSAARGIVPSASARLKINRVRETNLRSACRWSTALASSVQVAAVSSGTGSASSVASPAPFDSFASSATHSSSSCSNALEQRRQAVLIQQRELEEQVAAQRLARERLVHPLFEHFDAGIGRIEK